MEKKINQERLIDYSHIPINDQYILGKYWTGKIQTFVRLMKLGKCLPKEIEYVTHRYSDSSSIEETLYRMKHKIEVKPTCKVCGKPLQWTKKHAYQTYCSRHCANIDISSIYKRQEGLIRKYGAPTPFSSNDVIHKRNETWMKKYGGNPLGNKEIRSRIIPNPNPTKARETCRKKYGVDSFAMTMACKEKMKNTVIHKYGDYPCNLHKELAHTPEANAKRIATMKKNNSYSTSIPEETVYIELKKKCKVERQYIDTKYPFHCDFYIPSLDMYIECNFHWTHNTHQYDPYDIDDQQKVEEWKSHHSKYYDNAIKTWTVRDIKKYEIAKKNNLNYVVLYNESDVKKFYIQLDNKLEKNERK